MTNGRAIERAGQQRSSDREAMRSTLDGVIPRAHHAHDLGVQPKPPSRASDHTAERSEHIAHHGGLDRASGALTRLEPARPAARRSQKQRESLPWRERLGARQIVVGQPMTRERRDELR